MEPPTFGEDVTKVLSMNEVEELIQEVLTVEVFLEPCGRSERVVVEVTHV